MYPGFKLRDKFLTKKEARWGPLTSAKASAFISGGHEGCIKECTDGAKGSPMRRCACLELEARVDVLEP